MKLRNLLFIGLLAFGLAFNSIDADAQKVSKRYHQSISGDPIGLLAFGQLSATYEQQISADNTFTVFGYYASYFSWNAFGIGGSYRWYLLQGDTGKKPIEGFSAGPLAFISSWSYGGDGDYDGGLNFSIGAEAAYKWVFSSGFVVEPYIRLSFGLNNPNRLDYRPYNSGVNLGYAW